MAGPGTIVTAMNYAIGVGYLHITIIVSIFALMIYLTYLSFAYSDKLVKLVGENMIVVIAKLMGVILTIIGAGMVIDGIKLAFNLS